MEFNHYQRRASSTATYHEKGGHIIYPTLEIAGEAGEICDKIKKLIRDGDGIQNISDEIKHSLALELGDVLWGISALAGDLGFYLDQIATMNLDKLQSRKDRGVISGSGDAR